MPPERIARASAIWTALEQKGLRLLNRSGVALGRYDLLRRLHAEGRNSFNVFRPGELDAALRYPVFLRVGDDLGERCPTLLLAPVKAGPSCAGGRMGAK